MAGDWIALRHDLADDPAVLRIAAACKISQQHAVGCLHAVWSWFDRHTTNGKACELDAAFIDTLAGVEGFAQALESVGWLRVTSTAIAVPRFNRHMSQSAKTRQLTARRVARHRQRKRNADGVTESSPQNRTAESENKREQTSADAAAGADGSSDAEGGTARRRAGPATLGRILGSGNADAAAEANKGPVVLEIQQVLAERGCDVSFRQTVGKWGNVRIVRKLAAEFDRRRTTIRKPGGWWRTELRKAGMKAI